MAKDVVTRFVYHCPRCGARGSCYSGLAMSCELGHRMTFVGTQVLVRKPSGRRVWKREWTVAKDERVLTWRDLKK